MPLPGSIVRRAAKSAHTAGRGAARVRQLPRHVQEAVPYGTENPTTKNIDLCRKKKE